MKNEISIAQDFTRYPGPRYKRSGPFSGEEFREKILEPQLRKAIQQDSVLVVLLDDVAGYGSSFLDEAFAGLIRAGFTRSELEEHLRVEARTPQFRHHAIRALEYIAEESARAALAH